MPPPKPLPSELFRALSRLAALIRFHPDDEHDVRAQWCSVCALVERYLEDLTPTTLAPPAADAQDPAAHNPTGKPVREQPTPEARPNP